MINSVGERETGNENEKVFSKRYCLYSVDKPKKNKIK